MRIGAVSYLNTKPLIEYWRSAPEDVLVLDLPSRLADQLRHRELDVALVPAVEVFQQPELVIVPDACIACTGPVWSVKLLSRVPFQRIQTLSLDEGSRTSVVLCKVLLLNTVGVVPETFPLPIEADWKTVETDAVLVIGDRAMRADAADFPFTWDLGEIWNKMTGLPFVFAVWATHEDHLTSDPAAIERVQRSLNQARDVGVARFDQLANQHAAAYGLSSDECKKYFGQYLCFRFGKRERESLHRFHDMAMRRKFVPTERELIYHDCT
ncbi:MAG: menaquinone biosynthesis protein [Planctomycetaceae bacterium]|nr:menaquinone biosynthesis protein [Planctomycetaceae bacterium]